MIFFTNEHSSNGLNFEEVLRGNGAGNSSVNLNYEAIDSYPINGLNYYRLKQTDTDGQFTNCKVVFCGSNEVLLKENISIESLAPNPFSDHFTMNYKVAEAGILELQLINRSGVLVYKEKINADEGFNNYIYRKEIHHCHRALTF